MAGLEIEKPPPVGTIRAATHVLNYSLILSHPKNTFVPAMIYNSRILYLDPLEATLKYAGPTLDRSTLIPINPASAALPAGCRLGSFDSVKVVFSNEYKYCGVDDEQAQRVAATIPEGKGGRRRSRTRQRRQSRQQRRTRHRK